MLGVRQGAGRREWRVSGAAPGAVHDLKLTLLGLLPPCFHGKRGTACPDLRDVTADHAP
jgi:hypothetical protein